MQRAQSSELRAKITSADEKNVLRSFFCTPPTAPLAYEYPRKHQEFEVSGYFVLSSVFGTAMSLFIYSWICLRDLHCFVSRRSGSLFQQFQHRQHKQICRSAVDDATGWTTRPAND